jgi:hypothetical protein
MGVGGDLMYFDVRRSAVTGRALDPGADSLSPCRARRVFAQSLGLRFVE